MHTKTLFIFRRDLRLEDNTGLIFALKHAQTVIPCFIFTPEQIEHNSYLSKRSLQFMIESLEDLSLSLHKKRGNLFLFFDHPHHVVQQCIKKLQVDSVVVNRDYSPYSIKRDLKIESLCKTFHIPFYSMDDALLQPPENTLKSNGTPYTVFTPFYRNASQLTVPTCVNNTHTNYCTQPISFSITPSFYDKILPDRQNQLKGGRDSALALLKNLHPFSSYAYDRDFPSKDRTTHLSAHLKFTTCSPREVYHQIKEQLGTHSPLIRSLYWRDFFTSIAFHFPHVFKGAFHQKFNSIKWSNNKKLFNHWCEGTTGFPIVDAAMRELNQTGYMHNRSRMIVASFLVKDLHIDWRWGERYFAQHLIDYDPAVNNGNWQWAASTGCDAQPYFRIFNPWLQQMKFDPECLYIKRWIPELTSIPNQTIHKGNVQQHPLAPHYPKPLVDHKIEAKQAIALYKLH